VSAAQLHEMQLVPVILRAFGLLTQTDTAGSHLYIQQYLGLRAVFVHKSRQIESMDTMTHTIMSTTDRTYHSGNSKLSQQV
jgi:hypothetical protein